MYDKGGIFAWKRLKKLKKIQDSKGQCLFWYAMCMHIKAFHALSVCKEKLILRPGNRRKRVKKSKTYLGIHMYKWLQITNRLQIKANSPPIQESGLGTLGSLEDLVGNWKKVQTFSDFVIQVLDFFFFRWVTFVTSIPNWTRWRTRGTWLPGPLQDLLDKYFFINQVSFSRKLLVGQNKVKSALLLLPL